MNTTLKVDMSVFSKTDKSPAGAYCRWLISEGFDPSTKLEVYRSNNEPDLIVRTIGEGAKLTVKEEPNVRFVKFKGWKPKNILNRYPGERVGAQDRLFCGGLAQVAN